MADGFTYRGKHCSEFGITMLSYTLNSSELREYEDEAAGRAGSIDYGTELGKREINIRFDVMANDEPFKARQSRIMNWLTPTRPAGELVFDEMPDTYHYAKFTGKLGIEQINRYGTFDLTFKCTDPYAYGPERIFETTIINSPETIKVESFGDVESAPVIILTNVGSNTISSFTISNEYEVLD